MAFTGDESEVITLQEAKDWTATYRADNPGQVKAHFFGITQLRKILDQADCAGMRAYYAIDETNAKQIVLIGVGFDGKDMIDGIILDKSEPCPNMCDYTSPLV